MKFLAISEKVDFEEIEKAFKVVQDFSDIELEIPKKLSEGGVFGIEGLLAQLIATWLKNKSPEHILHTFCDDANQNDFDELGSKFYGMLAMKQSSMILSKNKTPVDQDMALHSAYERIRYVLNGNFHKAFDSPYVTIPSIKSKGINREFNCPFYLGDEVVGKNEFRKIVGKAIDRVIEYKNHRDHVDAYLDHISEMIRELFDNTHKHGRVDEKNNILPINFKTVIFRSTEVTSESLFKLINGRLEGMPGFVLECENWISTNKKNLPVLDITVVDAGSGYARKWTRKSKEEITFAEEAKAICSCFEKNRTTTDNNADGSGLTHVLKDLTKVRGWFRLRTGSASVSKSFFLGGNRPEIEINDVKEAGSFVEGTSFNIVMPLVNIS